MHYVHNPLSNTTVLVALMEGGVISSFTIENHYFPQQQRVKLNTTDIQETTPDISKRALPSAKRDKLAVISSLI